jgi:hypothetical protein
MKSLIVVLLAGYALLAVDSQWILEQSTLSYHISHTHHQVDGTSHAARGKAVCHEAECEILVAAPVKTFESGDSNRYLHMVQVARGAQFPLITVRFRLPDTAAAQTTIHADLEVQFAGQTATYKQVPFEQSAHGNHIHV